MSPDDLVERATRSLAESLRDEARHAPGGEQTEADGLLLCAGTTALPLPPNKAMAVADLDPDEALGRATAYFEGRRAGFAFQMRLGGVDEPLRRAAAAARPILEMDSAAMVAHRPLGAGSGTGAGGAELRPVVDPAGVADYVAVVDEAYRSLGWPEGGPAHLFSSPALLLQDRKVAVVAYLEGRPVAAAYVLLAEGLGLVSWVGTTSAARGRGLGAAVTRHVTDAAFERGAGAAWLTASAMGEPLYRRLGFAEFDRARSVVLWPSLPPPGG